MGHRTAIQAEHRHRREVQREELDREPSDCLRQAAPRKPPAGVGPGPSWLSQPRSCRCWQRSGCTWLRRACQRKPQQPPGSDPMPHPDPSVELSAPSVKSKGLSSHSTSRSGFAVALDLRQSPAACKTTPVLVPARTVEESSSPVAPE